MDLSNLNYSNHSHHKCQKFRPKGQHQLDDILLNDFDKMPAHKYIFGNLNHVPGPLFIDNFGDCVDSLYKLRSILVDDNTRPIFPPRTMIIC